MERAADGDTVKGHFADEGLFLALLEVGVLLAGDLEKRAGRIDTEVLGKLRADEDGVIPRDLGDRIGALLQPAVVGEAAVIDLGVKGKANL